MPDPTDESPTDLRGPEVADIRAAARRLDGVAVRTPLIESPVLNERVGGRILIKPECLQRTGSFKFRGAYNKISQLGTKPTATGAGERSIVAYSSGNHAQGVAAAARLAGLPAAIVMPEDAPRIKIENTRAHGAEVVFYRRNQQSREEIAAALADRRGATLVKPYDDPDIIAGQGTCGLELVEAAAALDLSLDAVLVCCGGGGLVAGCALAIHAESPETAVHPVEPESFDDTARSLAAGVRQSNAPGSRSICDALLAPTPGELTFAINRQHLSAGLTVADGEVEAAMAFAFDAIKLVVEPGGAVALAAILSGKHDCRGKTVGIVLSGGNVDRATYRTVLKRESAV